MAGREAGAPALLEPLIALGLDRVQLVLRDEAVVIGVQLGEDVRHPRLQVGACRGLRGARRLGGRSGPGDVHAGGCSAARENGSRCSAADQELVHCYASD